MTRLRRYFPLAMLYLALAILFSQQGTESKTPKQPPSVLTPAKQPETKEAKPDKTLFIHHISAGNGDATLIFFEGHSVLVDGGPAGTGGARIIPLLRQNHIDQLDYIIATHDDSDHTGGLKEVRETVGMRAGGRFIDGAAANPGVEPGFCIPFDPVVIEVMAVGGRTKDASVKEGLSPNSRSIALLLKFGKFKYFIGGDLTGGGRADKGRTPDLETRIARRVGVVDVLRVNHHGSGTSSNGVFLSALNPQAAIISVGNGGRNRALYHFPSRTVLDRLLSLLRLRYIYMTNQGETIGGMTDTDRKRIRIVDSDIVVSTTGEKGFRVGQDEFNF